MQKYQKRRLHLLQAELRSVQLATARCSRLAKIAHSVHRTLAECIRSEDRPSFASLFAAFHEATDGCTAQPVEAGNGQNNDSFLSGLPERHSGVIVEMMHQVRCNGDFIADRLATLTHREVLALLPDRASSRSNGSVLESSTGAFSRASRQLGYIVDGQTDLLSSLTFGSALETMILSVSGMSRSPHHDDRRAMEVWSTVCARSIAERRPGSDKLVPAVLDLWASNDAWPGRSRLELWMQRAMQRGAFLLDRPSKQSFRMRIQVRPEVPAQEDIQAETFYAEAVGQLLDLLADQSGATVIPEPALRMCKAIWAKLPQDSGYQHGLPRFILTRWLFPTFVPDAITLPEVGLRHSLICTALTSSSLPICLPTIMCPMMHARTFSARLQAEHRRRFSMSPTHCM